MTFRPGTTLFRSTRLVMLSTRPGAYVVPGGHERWKILGLVARVPQGTEDAALRAACLSQDATFRLTVQDRIEIEGPLAAILVTSPSDVQLEAYRLAAPVLVSGREAVQAYAWREVAKAPPTREALEVQLVLLVEGERPAQ